MFASTHPVVSRRSLRMRLLLPVLGLALLGPTSSAQASDLVDLATAAAKYPLNAVNRYLVRPVNNRVLRPTAQTVRYVFRGSENVGSTKGVPGFGRRITPQEMATGANLPESQKPKAYPGEYVVKNATGIADRSLRVGNKTRNKIANAVRPY